jgi:hypothetical protein
LLLSEAPSYWYSINTCFNHQLLIVASSSVVLIVVNSIQDDAPHNTPAVDCCVQQCQSSSLSLSWRWSWVTVVWCTKVGHCHPLRPLISSSPPLPSLSPSPSARPPPLSPSPLPYRPCPLRCLRATLIVITIALAALALALFVARQPRHHHHHPRCRLRRRRRRRHCPRCRCSPVTLVPSLLQPLPSPSSLHATLVADSILLVIALALFIPHQPHCPHHRPFHPRPLRCCHHHPPHALVVCRHPPSWSCGCLVNALLPATARLCWSYRWLIVVRLLLP